VGLILFTDRIERFVPPRKGARHVLRVIRELLYHEPASRRTNVAAALEYLDRVMSRRCVVFLISDFQSPDFTRPLRSVRRRHDLIPVLVHDERETHLPPVRFIELLDPETDERMLVDTSSRAFRRRYAEIVTGARAALQTSFRKLGIDTLDVATGESFVDPLRRFFRKREARR
jgi:uncharacterized protein (DUF58 family)